MGCAIITVGSMETSHCEYVLEDVLGQLQVPKVRVAPLLERHVYVSDFAAERGRIFRRYTCHILRFRACQLIDFADVGSRVYQNCRDNLRHILSRNRGGSAPYRMAAGSYRHLLSTERPSS
jgi:hypothetical protein